MTASAVTTRDLTLAAAKKWPAIAGIENSVSSAVTVLALHGDGRSSSSQIWSSILVPLGAAGVRVVAVDAPGFGKTPGARSMLRDDPVPFVRHVIDSLGASSVVLIGRSIGARAALMTAAVDKRVAKVVAAHPVQLPKETLRLVRQKVLLMWAKDDKAGQPYDGTHGAWYFVRQLPCADLLTWYESDYKDPSEFYRTLFSDRVLDFLARRRVARPPSAVADAAAADSKAASHTSISAAASGSVSAGTAAGTGAAASKSTASATAAATAAAAIEAKGDSKSAAADFFDFVGMDDADADPFAELSAKELAALRSQQQSRASSHPPEFIPLEDLAAEFRAAGLEVPAKLDSSDAESVFSDDAWLERQLSLESASASAGAAAAPAASASAAGAPATTAASEAAAAAAAPSSDSKSAPAERKSDAKADSSQHAMAAAVPAAESASKPSPQKAAAASSQSAVAVEQKGDGKAASAAAAATTAGGELAAARSVFAQTPYGRLHLMEQGPADGPVIFAMHGDGKNSSWRYWEDIMEPLARAGYRVFTVDMPGYGQSEGRRHSFRSDAVGVVSSLFDALKLKRVLLIGRSVGGKSAFLCAAADPKRIALIAVTHPVVPTERDLLAVRQPILLTWAKDDTGNHPYSGPHGAAYLVKITGCDLLSWTEKEYGWDVSLFYKDLYCRRLLKFARQHGFVP